MEGEEFLNKLYKDLNLSEEVLHTAKDTKNKDEAVKRYMDRLEYIHTKAINSTRKSDIEILKQLYHKKYVVKENNIPSYRDKNRIIQSQEESLDKWLDYLLDKNAKYPMWAKYWAFQGMLKIGTYDEANDIYQKRSKKTLAPFIEVNPEILAKCIGLVIDYVGKKELNDKELEKLIESGSFLKLYPHLIKRKKEEIHINSKKEEGIWITYHHETEKEADKKEEQGIIPEYLKLFNSLQGYNTGWCTAGDKIRAKNQICGGSSYIGGDFHVYYTKNKKGEYKIPRIAIRMDKQDIGEIRGIADNQNVEDGFEDIIAEKIKEFSKIKSETTTKYLKIIHEMKKLTELNKKSNNNESFTKEDIIFIYELDQEIDSFGYEKDPRIAKILSTRNIIEDYNKNSEIALKAVKKHWYAIEYINPNIDKYKEIALEAVKKNGMSLEYIDKNNKEYREIALEAIKENALAIQYLDKNIEGYKEIIIEAVKKKYYALRYVEPSIKGYEEIAMGAVKRNGLALEFVDVHVKNYQQIVLEAIKNISYAIQFVDKSIKNYKDFALLAVKKDWRAIIYVDKTCNEYNLIEEESQKKKNEELSERKIIRK